MNRHRISRNSYRRVKQNVALAFTFNGVGIPLATTGLVYPVWAVIAMAASVTAIFVNSVGARPALLFAAIGSVGRHPSAPELGRAYSPRFGHDALRWAAIMDADPKMRGVTMATTLAPEQTRECIDACTDCVIACHACADQCTQQTDARMLTCIRLCLSCADACLACLPSLARAANYEQLCRACADLCDTCAAECERYDDQTMRQCAEACRRAAQTCRQMTGG